MVDFCPMQCARLNSEEYQKVANLIQKEKKKPKISDEAFKMTRNSEVWECLPIPNTQVFHG